MLESYSGIQEKWRQDTKLNISGIDDDFLCNLLFQIWCEWPIWITENLHSLCWNLVECIFQSLLPWLVELILWKAEVQDTYS